MVTFIEALLDGEPMEIHGDGQQTRTFTYVDDTVDGIVRALEPPESRGEVVNVGGTETITILELARRVQAKLGHPAAAARDFPPVRVAAGQVPGRPASGSPTRRRRSELLGFEAEIKLDAGLRETVEWHRAMRETGATAQA